MIKLMEIEIGSYKLLSDTTLDLHNLTGIISLIGENRDISGFSSNSVGKSTLPNAILQCLFGKNLQGDSIDNCSNLYTGEKPNITITFSKDNVVYKIERNHQLNKLRLYIDGILEKFPNKNDVKAQIEKILGLNFFLTQNLIYISNITNSLFSTANNNNQASFIQSLLGLEFIADINKKAMNDYKEVQGDLKIKLKEVTMLQQQISNLQNQLKAMPKIDSVDYLPALTEINEALAVLEVDVKNTKSELDLYRSTLKEREKELSITSNDLKHLTRELKAEQDLINKGHCPTCAQSTSNLEPKTDINHITRLEKNLEQIDDEIADLNSKIAASNTSLKGINADMTKLNDAKKIIETKMIRQSAQNSSEDIRNTIVQQTQETVEKLVNAQEEMSNIEKQVYILGLITECSGSKGFIKQRVDLFLQLFNIELSALAKDLIGGEFKVSIAKTDSNHYELRVNDGIELNYTALSSGFKARLDILLALSLNKAVETLTGISLNVLFMDEILSSIDDEGVESISALLHKVEELFPTKAIFLVSHNQSITGVTKKLLVTRANNISKLTLI